MAENIIPDSFESWKHCVAVKCGIKLTAEYIEQRIQELKDQGHEHTRQFISLYGQDHYHNVLSWFERSKLESIAL